MPCPANVLASASQLHFVAFILLGALYAFSVSSVLSLRSSPYFLCALRVSAVSPGFCAAEFLFAAGHPSPMHERFPDFRFHAIFSEILGGLFA